jgi:ABC-type branched-subunit amino acid transport system ATPase component/predicted MFS family arabinose efflux permease
MTTPPDSATPEQTTLRGRMAAVTGGSSWKPLAVLASLNFVDEFDRVAFAALTPEIRDAFALSDTAIGAIGVVAGAFIILAAVPIGFFADRFNRVHISAVAAILWGTMSIATGLVPAVALLFLVRLIGGIGRVTNEIAHPSLLLDYYQAKVLPRVFTVYRVVSPIGAAIAGLVAGSVAAALSWEWAFFVLAAPTFLILGALVRLREPKRGESLDAGLAVQASKAESIPFGEARRQLYNVGSLRRIWLGSLILGTAFISSTLLVSLFFEHVYGFGPTGRGFVQFLYGAGTVVGLLVGLLLANRAVTSGDNPQLAWISGFSGVVVASGLALMVISPWASLSVFAVFAMALGAGSFQPAYYPLVGMVAPPRVRSQAYAWAIFFIAIGGLVGIGFFSLAEARGYRVSLGVLAATIAVGGLIAASAKRFVRRDIEQAQNTLATAADLQSELDEHGRQALLTCKGVEVAYGQVQVLFGVDLEVREGEIVALLGTNGAGKSTLLSAVSGLVDPIGGAIFFDGRDVTHKDANQTHALGISQVPGGKAIFPTLTVTEHLRLAAWRTKRDPGDVERATEDVLAMFPVLRERADQVAGNLSGGEQQMLGLGMAFVGRPKLLMIDELSLGLAPTIVGELLEVVRRIRDAGTAVIVVEQSVNLALTISDRAYFMEKGEVRFEGAAADLLDRGDLLRSVFLEGAAGGNGDARVEVREPEPDADPDATTEIVAVPAGDPILGAEGLVKRFGGITAVDGVDLALRKGETLGVIGPNGAGKTTLFDLLSGYLRPDGGRIHLADRDVTDLAPHRRAWLGLGRSFQDARLVPSLTVAENLALGLERHLDWHDHVAAALRLPAIVRLEEDIAWTVADLVELMGLGAYRDKFVRELSTGTRRVVDLAMVVAHDPDVLLLDEPSSGIAQRETEALGPLLQRIQRETGCGLLAIEHDMPLITSISDRLLAMDLGRPVTVGPPPKVISHPHVVASYLGGDAAAIHRSGALEEAQP